MRRDDGTFLWGGLTAVVLIWIVISSETKLCVSTPATSGPSVLSLSDLSNLKMDNSTVNADLANLTYWGSVSSAYTTSFAQIIPNTVIGFFDKSAEMRSWAFENIPSPPPWLSTGIVGYMDNELAFLRGNVLAAGKNATLAALTVKGFAASVVGYPLAALDYASMNGVTAIKTYLQTGNIIAAVCATYPSQLGALYDEAFNSSVPRERRAQYLGNALAVTTLMVVLAGKDGFVPKFQDALNRVGLADAWGTIKPYLSRIGSAVSARASMLTFAILEKLAHKFPQGPSWIAGFTSDRIDSMAEVLHMKGFSNDEIEQRIDRLARAANSSPNPDDIAYGADGISYDDGGGIRMKVDKQQRLWLYSAADTVQYMKASFLQGKVPGFVEGEATSLKVTYWEKGVTVYHHYEGGKYWMGTVPGDLAKPGDQVTLTIQVLTRDNFVKDLRSLTLGNEYGMRWMSNIVQLKSFVLNGDDLTIGISQDPAVAGISDFTIKGTAAEALGFSRGDTTLDLGFTDVFGRPRSLRIYFDGYGPVSLGISVGTRFSSVSFLAWDGTRLSIAYVPSEGVTRVATIYLASPSLLYDMGELHDYQLPYQVQGYSRSLMIDSVVPNRELEKTMAYHGSMSDVGRIGAEIAYSVAKDKLGLKDVVMNEPARPGADLFTKDGKVVMQARMLQRTADASIGQIKTDIETELKGLIEQLGTDFDNHHEVTTGFAILSYIDIEGSIKTIVLEVPTPVTLP